MSLLSATQVLTSRVWTRVGDRLARWAVVGVIVTASGSAVLYGCGAQEEISRGRIAIGVIAYGDGAVSLERLENFKNYLAEETNSFVEIEPTFNEVHALDQIRHRRWSLVFAPPGIAATAISTAQYEPLFPLQGSSNTVRSVIIVREDSPIEELADLQRHSLALGQPGSATGYYLPLYDLFGMTLAEVELASTPLDTMMLVANGDVTAGALSRAEFDKHEGEFEDTEFRIIHTSRSLPSGVVLIGPNVDRNLQEYITNAMNAVTPNLAAEAGYVPNADPPNYGFFIELIEKVAPYEDRIGEMPVVLSPANPGASLDSSTAE